MDRSISNSRPWMPYCSDVAHELPGEIVHRREDAPRHDIAVNLAWGLAGNEIQFFAQIQVRMLQRITVASECCLLRQQVGFFF